MNWISKGGSRQPRLDQFRDLAASWEVPGQDKTTKNVEWQAIPGFDKYGLRWKGRERSITTFHPIFCSEQTTFQGHSRQLSISRYEASAIRNAGMDDI